MNFRNRLVNISTCLVFAGIIVSALPAFAAGEDAKELAVREVLEHYGFYLPGQ